VRFYLVRHACAGQKDSWDGPDAERPLDAAGHRQAAAIAAEFAELDVSRLIASPARRCVETLEPLSRLTGLPIETWEALSADADISTVEQLEHLPIAGAVLCTHGEVLTRLLDDARARDATIAAERHEDDWLLSKGSAWVTEIDDGQPHIRHRAPLPIPQCPEHEQVGAA
jgi:phosphohistidine phosphatase SixA